MVRSIIEATVTLVLAYLVIANAINFSIVVQSMASGYSNVVKTLQGR